MIKNVPHRTVAGNKCPCSGATSSLGGYLSCLYVSTQPNPANLHGRTKERSVCGGDPLPLSPIRTQHSLLTVSALTRSFLCTLWLTGGVCGWVGGGGGEGFQTELIPRVYKAVPPYRFWALHPRVKKKKVLTLLLKVELEALCIRLSVL